MLKKYKNNIKNRVAKAVNGNYFLFVVTMSILCTIYGVAISWLAFIVIGLCYLFQGCLCEIFKMPPTAVEINEHVDNNRNQQV